MASDPSPAPSRVEEAWALVDDWTGFRRTNPLYGLIHRIATALQAAEQRGRQEGMREMRERAARAAYGAGASLFSGMTEKDAARAGRRAAEDAIRALPIDGEPKGEEK